MKSKIITLMLVAICLTMATLSLPLVEKGELSIAVPIMFWTTALVLSLNLPQAKSVNNKE